MPDSCQCGFKSLPGSLSGQHLLLLHGPTLLVRIGFDPNFIPGQRPNIPVDQIPALVDTGAYESYIDSQLAKQLALPIVDRLMCSGSAGRHEIDACLAHIIVSGLDVNITGRFGAVKLSEGGQRHQALIGRTFLMHFKLTYNGSTGDVELSQP